MTFNMQQKSDGAAYAPQGRACPACRQGELPVGVIGLDHGHIYGMCNGLSEAGAPPVVVYDPDAEKVRAFLAAYPGARAAHSAAEVLEDSAIRLIACASIPARRCAVGLAAMEHGKDFFSDKPSFTTPAQLAQARETAARTKRRFMVYFSERLHVEASVYAEQLLREGTIGRVVQVMGWGPHRLNEPTRPAWFFDREQYGGILTDLGCHQIEQLVFFAGASGARIISSRTGNYAHTQHPSFEDFGDATLVCDNGVTGYFRVDWFTPDGLGAWGDGRTLVVGTKGYLEIRKYIDLASSPEGDHIYYANEKGEFHVCAAGKCGFPFFGRLVRDCLDRTETAMTQEHVFKTMELALDAQAHAVHVGYTTKEAGLNE